MSNPLSSFYSKIATSKTRATLTALLVFLLPFERIPSLDIFSVTIRLSQIVGLALVFVSVRPIIKFYTLKPYLPKLLLPTFLFSYLLSAIIATDLKRSIMVFVFTLFVVLVGSAIAATLTADELPRIEKYLFWATAIVLLFGFYQYFGDVFGLPPAYTGLRDIYTKAVFGYPRIQSTALEPLYYGSFLLIPYCVLLNKRLTSKLPVHWGESFLLFGIVTQVALSVSRGALIGGAVALVAIIALHGGQKTIVLRKFVTTILLIAAALLVAYFMTLVSPDTDNKKYSGEAKTESLIAQATNLTSQDDRVRNRTIALHAFKQQPLLGIGPGNFSQYAIAEYPKYKKAAPVIVNNEPLELLAEAGIIGFILFVLFVGWIWSSVLINYLKSDLKGSKLSYWAPALLIYSIALAIQYQTFSTLYVMHVWVIIGLLMAFGIKRFTKT